MSKATNEEMKQEALERILDLVEKNGLNPKTYEYFENDRLYYSYLTGGGLIGSIDTIFYEPSYERAVKKFEMIYDVLVYHCVEDDGFFGKTLIMLYVSRNKGEWKSGRLKKNGSIMANVLNMDDNFDEIGTVKFDSYQGALVRVG